MTDGVVDPRVEVTVDRTGTAALYRAHVPSAVRLAFLLTGDAASAQDVAHDAFLRAASRLRLMRNQDHFGAYLRRAVVRSVLMRHRSMEREQARAKRVAHGLAGVVDDPAGNASAHFDLVAALRTLPSHQKSALVLRYWLDLSEADIALAMGCRPGTVKSSLSRGLEALRKVLPADA